MARLSDARQIHVLVAFVPFFRILKAYNVENFQHLDRRQILQNICLAMGAFVFAALIASTVQLQIWYLIDQRGDMRKVVVSGPLIISIASMLIIAIILTATNRDIAETIKQLQSVIDQRKHWHARRATVPGSAPN